MEEHQQHNICQENHDDKSPQTSQTPEHNTTETEQKVINKNHKDMINELHYKFRLRKRKTALGQQLETQQIGSGSCVASKNGTNFKLSLVENCSFWALVISAIIIILKFVYLLVRYINVS